MERTDRFIASLSDEGRYRILIDAITDYAVYMLDPTGIVSSWNPGAQRFKGYTAEEIVGRHFSTFYSEEDRKSGLPARALEAARTQGKFEGEGWRIRKDGTRFWAYVIIDPIRDPDGNIIGFAKVTRDITERRENQLRLEKAQEALVQSQKMDAIGQLTGGIAHDFNNLLMAISSSLELIRKRLPEDPKLEALLENALRGTERGAILTKRLLAFARRQDLKQEVVHIPDLVGGMTELLQRSLGPAFEIETRFPLVLKPVKADANQLEMALLNLAVNARDAMPDGGQIVIRAREETVDGKDAHESLKPGNYVYLAMSDTGTGMDAATLQRAMEPFFTTKGVGKGTGLGLSMVHGFAEQTGGRFRLQSRKGKGTTAELWLPVAEQTAAALAKPQPEPPAKKPARHVVLAVDDDWLILNNTVAMLEDLGHTGIAATSGKEALEILERDDAIELVITDQAMPQMTGVQLAAAIRLKWPDLPVMLATGYAEVAPGTKSDLPKLTKPFGQAELAKALALVDDRVRKNARVVKFPRNGALPS